MSISDDIATIRNDTQSAARRGSRDTERNTHLLNTHFAGIWDALEVLAKAIDEDRG